jgi:quercetin dioxygenase-like cupin family protein|tara:strand:+ start:285 stop:659 length:375 start_codon:yes stop_codon:yes gene_type:complete
MIKIKKKINFKDKRGIIVDLIEKTQINAITYITQKKNTVRGNHFHKKTIQWNYILSGKVILVTKKGKGKKIKKIMKKGDLILTEKNEKHAIKALVNSEMLVFTKGPRGGKEYESDTYKLTDNLV